MDHTDCCDTVNYNLGAFKRRKENFGRPYYCLTSGMIVANHKTMVTKTMVTTECLTIIFKVIITA